MELSDLSRSADVARVLQRTGDDQLVIVSESSRFRTLPCISGLYLKYLGCKCLTLHRCLLLMMILDPFVIVCSAITIIPILQIDGTKIDIQIVLVILKIALLLLNLRFLQGMVCHRRFR